MSLPPSLNLHLPPRFLQRGRRQTQELAPLNKVRRSLQLRFDNWHLILEIDEDYISFINSLNAPPSKPTESDTIEALSTSNINSSSNLDDSEFLSVAASKPPPEPETTPLLEALRADKQAQRDRETILKAHAHYQRGDVDGTGTSGRRRGGKAIAVPPPQADKDDGGATGSGGKRRRGKKGEGKERGKEREQAPPSAKGVGKGGPKTISTAVPASTKDKDVSKDKEGPKEKEKPARALLQMALSGAGIRRGDKKSTAAVPASGLESSGKLAIPAAAAATILQADTEKDKTKEKPESGQGQPLTSPGRERGRGGRRRGDSAKSPSRVVKQAQAITPGQGGSTGELTFNTPPQALIIFAGSRIGAHHPPSSTWRA